MSKKTEYDIKYDEEGSPVKIKTKETFYSLHEKDGESVWRVDSFTYNEDETIIDSNIDFIEATPRE